MMHSMKQVVLVGAMGIVIACTSTPTDSLAASSALSLLRQQLVAELNECTHKYGYHPDQTAGVAENALAPNELPWRQCAYDAVRAYANEHPSLSGLYTQLIDEDIAMTAQIQQGTLTRSGRRARIEALLAEIRAAEDFQISAADQNPSWSNQERSQLGTVAASVHGFY